MAILETSPGRNQTNHGTEMQLLTDTAQINRMLSVATRDRLQRDAVEQATLSENAAAIQDAITRCVTNLGDIFSIYSNIPLPAAVIFMERRLADSRWNATEIRDMAVSYWLCTTILATALCDDVVLLSQLARDDRAPTQPTTSYAKMKAWLSPWLQQQSAVRSDSRAIRELLASRFPNLRVTAGIEDELKQLQSLTGSEFTKVFRLVEDTLYVAYFCHFNVLMMGRQAQFVIDTPKQGSEGIVFTQDQHACYPGEAAKWAKPLIGQKAFFVAGTASPGIRNGFEFPLKATVIPHPRPN